MEIKKFKEYICEICNKNFGNKKDHFEAHKNKKKPCVKKSNDVIQIALNSSQIPPKFLQTPHLNQEPKKNNNNVIDELCTEQFSVEIKFFNNKFDEFDKLDNLQYKCEYCKKIFAKKYNMLRHQNSSCKQKQLVENKSNENQTNIINQIKEQLNILIKQNEKLNRDYKKIKKELKFKKNKTDISIVNNNNINNNVINQNILVNFNDLNYEDMDKKLFTTPLLNSRLQGKFIILQMIENVYINASYPEYHNLIITDKNRGYVKIYNNGRWKTDNINTINKIIDEIISHSKNIIVELKQHYINNTIANNRLNTSEKYVNLCDREFLADLEDEHANGDVNNTNQIQRCKDFREMIYKDTINLFHDNKDLLFKQKNNKIVEI